jgi:4-amino-4-deoxy-L-arabinose transferase-like glycosyltransferase
MERLKSIDSVQRLHINDNPGFWKPPAEMPLTIRQQDQRQQLLDGVIIFFLALAVRLAWTAAAVQVDPFLRDAPLHGDAASYDRIIQSLLAGTGFSEHPPAPGAFWPPLYPYVMSLFYALVGYHLEAGRLVQVVFGAMVPLGMYLVTLRIFNRPVAWLTAAGLIIYPYLVYFGAWLIADTLYMSLLVVALWLCSRIVDHWSLAIAGLIGCVLGLSALTKPVTLLMLPFFVLWLFFAPRNLKLLRKLSLAGLLLMFFFLVLLPWTVRNYLIFEKAILISTNGAYTLLGANNPAAWGGHSEGVPALISGLDDASMADIFTRQAVEWIQSNPLQFLRLLPVKYLRLLSPLSVASSPADYPLSGAGLIYWIYGLYLISGLAGILLSLRSWRRCGFLYAPLLGVLVSTALFYGDVRYTLPMVPSLVLFASLFVVRVWKELQQKVNTRNAYT